MNNEIEKLKIENELLLNKLNKKKLVLNKKIYIFIVLIVLILLVMLIFILNKKPQNKYIAGKWYNYESDIHTYLNKQAEYKDCRIIEFKSDGTFEEYQYSYWPFKQSCEDCVFGDYVVPKR